MVMTEIEGFRPVLAMLPSLVGAFLLLAFDKRPNIRDGIGVVAAAAKWIIVVSIFPVVLGGGKIVYTLFDFGQALPGVEIAFKVDAFGLFFAFLSSTLWVVTHIYAVGYMRSLDQHKQTRFFFCFTLSLFAAIGIAFSANLLTMFIFYEILSLITYPLVIHEEDTRSFRNGVKYLIYLVGASFVFQLTAVLIIYGMTGTMDYTEGGIMGDVQATELVQIAIFVLLILGYAKAALVPVHSWLPSAMVAPTPVSALLHAVAVVVAGVFCVLRVVFHVYGPEHMNELGLDIVLGIFASVTILLSIIYALTQNNLKMRIAYSTVNQLSIMMLGAATLSYRGMLGGILHIASHSFAKITMFFVAGAIFVTCGKKYVSELDGIGKKMPLTMLAFFVGTLGIAGAPPTLGLLSKIYIAMGAIDAGHLLFLGVLLISSLLDIICFFPIVYVAFFKPLPEGVKEEVKEAPYMVLVPLLITAILTVVLFFSPSLFYDLAEATVRGLR